MHNLLCSMVVVAASAGWMLKVNYTMIVIAAVAQWLLGALWYGLIFRKSWKKMTGVAETKSPVSNVFALVTSFVACLLLCYVLEFVLGLAGASVFTSGAKIAILCWVGFMAPPLFAQHIQEQRRANLFAINAGYWLLAMGLAGGLLAAIR